MKRDRVSAGIKAAVVNMQKRPDYYSWIAKLRGLKKRQVKYNDNLSSDNIMANAETIEYIVEPVDVQNLNRLTKTFGTRQQAREYKRILQGSDIKSKITQVQYDGDFIVENRVIR